MKVARWVDEKVVMKGVWTDALMGERWVGVMVDWMVVR